MLFQLNLTEYLTELRDGLLANTNELIERHSLVYLNIGLPSHLNEIEPLFVGTSEYGLLTRHLIDELATLDLIHRVCLHTLRHLAQNLVHFESGLFLRLEEVDDESSRFGERAILHDGLVLLVRLYHHCFERFLLLFVPYLYQIIDILVGFVAVYIRELDF